MESLSAKLNTAACNAPNSSRGQLRPTGNSQSALAGPRLAEHLASGEPRVAAAAPVRPLKGTRLAWARGPLKAMLAELDCLSKPLRKLLPPRAGRHRGRSRR